MSDFNPPLPEWIAGRDEVEASEQHARVGTMDAPPPPDHVLVVALARFIDPKERGGSGDLMLPGQHFYMHRDRIAANVERGLVHVPSAMSFDWWQHPGRILAAEPCDAVPLLAAPREGSLKIVQGTGYDPGAAAFRLHTAINEATQHASAFARWGHSNPHCDLRQLDGEREGHLIRQAVLEADVLHHHIAPFLVNNTGLRPQAGQLVIRHYHGSAEGGRTHIEPEFDRAEQYTLLGARLSLVAEAKAMGLEMDWSPIPVPVARYRALRDAVRAEVGWVPLEGPATAARPLRIAHSPTNTRIKGTDVLRTVVQQLQAKGVPVVVDYIRGVSLAESLRRKALCDVCFDSFWLGIQGSGLEAGAMEMPVIAGDVDVVALYRERIGDVPYTFANEASQLAEAIELLAVEADYRVMATDRVASYVAEYHDYAAVARRYEATLSKALGRDVRTKRLDDGTVTDGIFMQKVIEGYQPAVGATIEIGDEQLSEADASIPESGGDKPRTLLGLPIVENAALDTVDVEELEFAPLVPRRKRRGT